MTKQDSLSLGLTSKQVEVLDRLLDLKTSKEIARDLRISHHTVDQRIASARRKLGAGSRSELVVRYRKFKESDGKAVYGDPYIGKPAIPMHPSARNDAENALVTEHPNRTSSVYDTRGKSDYRVGPEMFVGRFGTLMRILAIFAIAFLTVFLGIGSLAIFGQLSAMLSR